MTPLIITNNPNLASTTRVLQDWLRRDNPTRLNGCVVLPREGAFSKWLESQQIPFMITPMPRPNKRWPVPGLWYAWRVASWAKAQGCDMLHCNEHDVYPFGAMLKRLVNWPTVCHVRFRITPEFCQWMFCHDERKPDALLWTSHQQKQDCADAVGDLIAQENQHVVALGADLSAINVTDDDRKQMRKAWGVDEDQIVLGTASALRPIKQIEHFIKLTESLVKEGKNVTGVIAGDAPSGLEHYRDQLVEQIEATNLSDRIQWVGHTDNVFQFLAGTDIFVSTSKYESFGNSVCEAMATSTPVVGYTGGSVHEVLGDPSRIALNGDLPTLTNKVRSLVEDVQLRNACGERDRQRVADVFNPAVSLEKLRAVYGRILETERALRWAA